MDWKKKEFDAERSSLIAQKLQISPFLAQLLCSRGLDTIEKAYYFLYGDLENTLSPFIFKDMEKTVLHLRRLIEEKRPIYIMGDKDVDGITGAAILYSFFERAGLTQIHYNLPSHNESYGFSERIIEHILSVEGLDTVITVDCGIKENEFIDFLAENGIDTIITDHHIPAQELPRALGIIDPHVEGEMPIGHLSGAAVALKVIQALYFSYSRLFYNQDMLFLSRTKDYQGILSRNFVPGELDLVFSNGEKLLAFTKSYEKLIIVSENGLLKELKGLVFADNIQLLNLHEFIALNTSLPSKDKTLEQLAGLFQVFYSELKPHRALFSLMKKIFFKFCLKIDEKLNAIFRLAALGTVCDYMPLNLVENHILVKRGLDLINKNVPLYIKLLSPKKNDELVNMEDIGFKIGPMLNSSGRLGQPEISFQFLIEDDEEKLQRIFGRLQELNKKRKEFGDYGYKEAQQDIELHQQAQEVICFSSRNIIQGVTGIIATKIAQYYKKPSFIFSVDERQEEVIGSGRSFHNIDLLSIIDDCQGIFTRFGGHKKACGMSFPYHCLDEVVERIKEQSHKLIDFERLEDINYYDLEVAPESVNFTLLQQIKLLYPFGPENEEPIFLSVGVTPVDYKLIGKDNKHLKFKVRENPTIDFVAWKMSDKEDLVKRSKVDLFYKLKENIYNNHIYLQGEVVEMRESRI